MTLPRAGDMQPVSTSPLEGVLRFLRDLDAKDQPSDAVLLDRFVSRRDEAAFAALLHRHGPLVLGTCRQVLHHAHDAEDAFQAVFLILARRAASIRRTEALAAWLHRVACNVAHTARTSAARPRAHERQSAATPPPNREETPPADRP